MWRRKDTTLGSHKVDVKKPTLLKFVTFITLGYLLNAKTHLGLD